MIQYLNICDLICTTINKKEDGSVVIGRGQSLDQWFLLFYILLLLLFWFSPLHPGGGVGGVTLPYKTYNLNLYRINIFLCSHSLCDSMEDYGTNKTPWHKFLSTTNNFFSKNRGGIFYPYKIMSRRTNMVSILAYTAHKPKYMIHIKPPHNGLWWPVMSYMLLWTTNPW